MNKDALKSELDKRRQNMLNERQDWEPRWKKIQEVVAPVFGYFDERDKQGKRRWSSLYNDTPMYATLTLSAGLQSGLTSPNQQWYHLNDPDPRINEDHDVRKYCMDCEHIMSADMLSCGIYDAYSETYNNLGPFGTGGFLILEDTRRPFTCVPQEIGQYCIAQDYRRTINEFLRDLVMTPAQMTEQFGLDRVPDQVQNAFKNDTPVKYKVHHLITPNDGRIDGAYGVNGKSWLSFYWMDESEQLLDVGGYEEFPFIGGRWYQIGQDVYGYGPGEIAFGNSSQLQAMEKDKTTARQLTVQPPIQIPSTLKDKVSLLPAAQIYYDPTSGGAAPIQPLLNVKFDLNGAMEDIVVTEERIKRAFYTQLFTAILDRADQNPQKTATEIQEMISEKSSMIGPVLQRLDRELLRKSIDRVYAIEARAGRLPEPPQILEGRALNIEYTSPLMLALNTRKTASIDRFIQFVGGVSQAKPEILDLLNTDKVARMYANFIDLPPECIFTEEETDQMRQDRARQQQQLQQQQQMAELAKQAPDALKKLGETQTQSDGTLLGDIMSQAGQGGGM